MTLTVLINNQQALASPLLPRTNAQQTATKQAAAATLHLTLNTQQQQQQQQNDMRVHKRHAAHSWHEIYEKESQLQDTEWANPCGGLWLEESTRAQPVKTTLRWLQSNVSRELKTLRAATNTAINTNNMRSWPKSSHNFLPVIKLNSNVALRRWHRYLQIYVASFTYLRRAEMHWDHHELQRGSPIYFELDKLKQSALSMLCEIETAINNTSAYTHKSRHSIKTIKRAAMEKRLQFQSQLKHVYGRKWDTQQSQELHELIQTDLKIAKHRYLTLLRAMVKVLRTHTKRPGQLTLDSRSTSSSSSSSSKGSSKQLHSSQQSAQSALLADSKDYSNSINSYEANLSQSTKVHHRIKSPDASANRNKSVNLSANKRHKQSHKPKPQA